MNNANMPAMPIKHKDGSFVNFKSHHDAGYFEQEGAMLSIGLTKREQACIALCLPETGDEELDAIIRKAQRAKIVTAAMQGLCHATNPAGEWHHDADTVAYASVEYADTVLAVLESTK